MIAENIALDGVVKLMSAVADLDAAESAGTLSCGTRSGGPAERGSPPHIDAPYYERRKPTVRGGGCERGRRPARGTGPERNA
jgi:hypothetical protein